VIPVAEELLAFVKVSDARVLEGDIDIGYGDLEQSPARRLEDASELPECFLVFGYVFEHVGAVDNIEGILGKVDISNVELNHGLGVVQIRREVLKGAVPLEAGA